MPPLNENREAVGCESPADVGRQPLPQAHDAAAGSRMHGREYWRSLDDFVDSPDFQQFVENEFPSQLENVLTPASRRSFLKLMGASVALAGVGLQGCRRWPNEKIAPFARRPDNYVPGEAQYFASAFELGGVGHGVLVKSFDGRPIKIEGNEHDPIHGFAANPNGLGARGSSDQYAQAGILEMYDPDRSRQPVQRVGDEERPGTMAEFHRACSDLFEQLRARRGRRVAILSETTSSDSFVDMRARVQDVMPSARWYEWEPLSRDNEIEGSRLAFGEARRAQYDASNADVLVCLDSDFLITHPAAAKHAREFAARRSAVDRTMPRLYAVEGVLSLTGAIADHRLKIRSRDVAAFAALLARRLTDGGAEVLGASDVSLPMSIDDTWNRFVGSLVRDLLASRGRSIVVAGPRQPAEVHAIVHAINFALGNAGQTINYTREPEGNRAAHHLAISQLCRDAEGGAIDTLIILGGNPAFDAPADVEFAESVANVGEKIHLSLYENETSALCHWHVPMAHWLESWGDARAWDGTVTVRQPLILPLYDGLSPIELLAMMAGDEAISGYEIVRRRYIERRGDQNLEHAWRTLLSRGVEEGSAWPYEDVSLDAARWTDRLSGVINAAHIANQRRDASMEVVFTQDYKVYDGRFANNGWLQELPDPIGKICWDNAAYVSPATADRLEARGDDLLHIEVFEPAAPGVAEPPSRRTTIVLHVVPGMADDVIAVNIGYGRTSGGHICREVGFNVNVLRTARAAGMGMHFASARAERQRRGRYRLATTQDHHAMSTRITEHGKQARLGDIFREASLDDFIAASERGKPMEAFVDKYLPPIVSLWEEWKYEPEFLADGTPNPQWSPNKWAMAIDLNSCTGCSACVIACQAENNIPIVGKQQVQRGREMHWIRIDRYFKGNDPNDPSIVFQPVACVHCETAPCEQVCPVAATTHDRDGLNVMVYNRCVGTRYCSNNCPYKVRRFNFYDWHVEDPKEQALHGLRAPGIGMPDAVHDGAFRGRNEVKRMMFNPDVTVRMRGVMEKCTYCLQRINKAKIGAKNAWAKRPDDQKRPDERAYYIPDGTFTTACAQACPSNAIVFGDLHDPDSRVTQLFRNKREYSLLEELNTKPRTRYLAKIRNHDGVLPTPAPYEDMHYAPKSVQEPGEGV